MKNYILFSDNGQILRTGQCQDSDFALLDKNVIEGTADDATQYIEKNLVVDMPVKPDGAYVFDYETKKWIKDTPTQEYKVKQKRNRLLLDSDWTQMPDVNLTNKQAWVIYRQELRDITSQSGYPFEIIWPEIPR